jgi:hypothetical protein
MMAGEHRIKNYHVDEAIEQINQSGYGAHFNVYHALRVLRQLYRKYIKTQLEHENKLFFCFHITILLITLETFC